MENSYNFALCALAELTLDFSPLSGIAPQCGTMWKIREKSDKRKHLFYVKK